MSMFMAFTKYWQRENMYLKDYRKIFCKLLTTPYILYLEAAVSNKGGRTSLQERTDLAHWIVCKVLKFQSSYS